MAKALLLLLASILSGICVNCKNNENCGKALVTPALWDIKHDRIVGGVFSKRGSWPWLVALATPNYVRTSSENFQLVPNFVCGGTIISDRCVLTAGHCSVEDFYLARLGIVNLEDATSNVDMSIKEMKVHPDFNLRPGEHDIAIVILEKRITFNDLIQPICLPRSSIFQRQTYKNVFGYVTGWGDQEIGSESGSTQLREIQVPVTDLEECREIYQQKHLRIYDTNICAGFREGGKDACQGDSGGPLMIRRGERAVAFYVVGIVSHGWGCATPGIPGVYTRVDSYITWIDSILKMEKSIN